MNIIKKLPFNWCSFC